MGGRVYARACLFLVALACGGCGTVRNICPTAFSSPGDVMNPTSVYGGVRQDWANLREMRSFSDVGCINYAFLPFWLADLSLTLVGDTVTLPYTVGVEIARSVGGCSYPMPDPKEPERPHSIAGTVPGSSNK